MIFPKQIDDVTPDWLNQILIKNGVIDREQIVGFDAVPVEKQGMTSMVHVLSLKYDRDPMPAHVPEKLVFKASLDHPAVKAAMAKNLGFQREVAFYNNFGHGAGIPVPRCYAAEFNGEDDSCMLLLDFIGNTREGDLLSGTVKDIETAVRHLAAFHATWWNRKDVLAHCHPHQVSLLLGMFTEKLSRSLENARTLYRAEVGETLISLMATWLPNAPFFDNRFKEGPVTLIHGDFNRNQLLFPMGMDDPMRLGESASKKPPYSRQDSICVIDWQLAAVDPGPTDLAQIIVTGLFPEQRRKVEAGLLEMYYQQLLRHGVTDYSFQRMQAQYKLGLVKLMLFYLCALEVPDVTPILEYWKVKGIKGTSFWDVNFRWPAMALDDNEVLDFLGGILSEKK